MIKATKRKAIEIIKNPQFNVFKVVPGVPPSKRINTFRIPIGAIVFNSFKEFEIAAETLMRDRGWHLEGRD